MNITLFYLTIMLETQQKTTTELTLQQRFWVGFFCFVFFDRFNNDWTMITNRLSWDGKTIFSITMEKGLRLERQHQLEVVFTYLHNRAVTIIVISAENKEPRIWAHCRLLKCYDINILVILVYSKFLGGDKKKTKNLKTKQKQKNLYWTVLIFNETMKSLFLVKQTSRCWAEEPGLLGLIIQCHCWAFKRIFKGTAFKSFLHPTENKQQQTWNLWIHEVPGFVP